MAVNIYECLMILDANAYARDPGGAANNIKELIEKSGGEVKASRLWNEQKLAYPIRGRHKGAYWLTYFAMESTALSGFDRACRLNDLIMRHLPIKIDPRISDDMIAVAKGEKPASSLNAEEENNKDGKDATENKDDKKPVETADA